MRSIYQPLTISTSLCDIYQPLFDKEVVVFFRVFFPDFVIVSPKNLRQRV